MPESTMDQLLRLHELEKNIRQLEADVKRVGPQVAQLASDEEKRGAVLVRMRERNAAAEKERRAAEVELKSAEQKLTRLRQQMDRIATAKELTALEHETTAAAAEVSRLEELILNRMEEEEQLTADLTKKTSAAGRMTSEAAAQKQRLEQLAREKTDLGKALQEERIALRNQLPDDVKEMCDWLAKRHNGEIVAGLKGQACGGCGGILVPNLLLDVQQSHGLQQCNHCRRFLHA